MISRNGSHLFFISFYGAGGLGVVVKFPRLLHLLPARRSRS